MLLSQVQECPQGQEAISNSCLHRPEWKTVQVYANFGPRFLGQPIARSKAQFCNLARSQVYLSELLSSCDSISH